MLSVAVINTIDNLHTFVSCGTRHPSIIGAFNTNEGGALRVTTYTSNVIGMFFPLDASMSLVRFSPWARFSRFHFWLET